MFKNWTYRHINTSFKFNLSVSSFISIYSRCSGFKRCWGAL